MRWKGREGKGCLIFTSNGQFPVSVLKSSNVAGSASSCYHYEQQGRADQTVEDQYYEDHHIVGLEILHILVQSLGQSSGRGRDLEY